MQKEIPFLSEKGIGFTCGDKTSENGGYAFALFEILIMFHRIIVHNVLIIEQAK